METQAAKMQRLSELMATSGPELIIPLLVLIIGLLLIKRLLRGLRTALGKMTRNKTRISIICNSLGVLLFALVIIAAAAKAGLKLERVVSILTIISLAEELVNIHVVDDTGETVKYYATDTYEVFNYK